MDITMEHNTQYKIEGLFDNTNAIFENARTSLRTILNIDEFREADPNNLQIEIFDYAAAIDILGELIIDDIIVDEEAFSIIRQLAEKYLIWIGNDYPAIGKLLKSYITELDNHYSSRFEQ